MRISTGYDGFMAKRKSRSAARYKNQEFLRRLGRHCQSLRLAQDYSIDRMAKESDQLSPSVIHRLESGSGAVTVATLFRYAEVLRLSPEALWKFDMTGIPESRASRPSPEILPNDHPSIRKGAFKDYLPLYSLKAAAGYFGRGESVHALGWLKVSGSLDPRMFVVQALGDSMQPKIEDGDYLIMRADPSGTRHNKIVLAEYKGPADPDTGGSYTVKKYSSSKVADKEGGWTHGEIRLEPLNPAFEPIVIPPAQAQDFRIVAECVRVLNPAVLSEKGEA